MMSAEEDEKVQRIEEDEQEDIEKNVNEVFE